MFLKADQTGDVKFLVPKTKHITRILPTELHPWPCLFCWINPVKVEGLNPLSNTIWLCAKIKLKKKGNIEGSLWELAVRTPGNKMRLWPYACTPSLHQEDRLNYSINYCIACETKERK